MKDAITIIVVVIALGLIFGFFQEEGPSGRYYDCGMAEWHPDIPKEVKEECRRRAYEHWKEQQKQQSRVVI